MGNVSIRTLRKSFGPKLIVDDLNLDIAEGEFFVLLGPSGCGKTTTLRCVAGLEKPDAGVISLGPAVVADPARYLFVPPNKRDIGMVFQSYALWPHMTVVENVAYPLKARRMGKADIAAGVKEALQIVGLAGFESRIPSQLSGGQQQRVALARAIVAKPQLLLFDEPLSNLDAQLRIRLRADLRRLHERARRTAIYVTHDQTEAVALADRVAVMKDGKIEQIGAPKAIFLSPSSRFVAEFVGFDNFIGGTIEDRTDDQHSVRVSGWSRTLSVISHHRFVKGSSVVLAFRSSSLIVIPDDPPSVTQDVASGTLREVTYLGECYQCVVDVGDVPVTGTVNASFANVGARPGQRVRLSFAPASVVLLPATGLVSGAQTTPLVPQRQAVV